MRRILFTVPLLSLLALPLHGEEALHGSWEGSHVDEEGNNVDVTLTFTADGGFQMSQKVMLGPAFQGVVASTDIAVEAITVDATGTYQVDGDKMQVEVTELVLLVDGRPMMEVLTEVARALAAIAAGFAGVSEEDYPAFEAAFVNDFLGEMSEQDFLAEFSGEEVTWAVEGDTLSITAATEDGGEETMQYQRVADAGTAVSEMSWGALKANSRR